MKSEQFLVDSRGRKTHVVLTIEDYDSLLKLAGGNETKVINPLIKLPHAGSEDFLDTRILFSFIERNNIKDLAVNKRAQKLEDFVDIQKQTLDPLIRVLCLSPDSPYRNTMQATTEVVDALVDTGVLERKKIKYDFFSRAVNSLVVNQENLKNYLDKFGRTSF